MKTKTAQTTTPADAGAQAGAERVPMPVPPGGWPPDEYTGLGGNYVRDPYTGIRRPADAPEAAKPDSDPAGETGKPLADGEAAATPLTE